MSTPARKSSVRRTQKTSSARKASARKAGKRHTSAKRRAPKWSGRVTATSDALDLKHHLFKQRSPTAIARSLKRSAERSHRRKASPYQSAMSMLNFYINRGGKNLSAAEKKKLNAAKGDLRKVFGRAA
jgi:hypothetical protein